MLEFERKLEKQNEICSINTLGVLARGRSHLSHWPWVWKKKLSLSNQSHLRK
jgi:hypothetical protein